MLYDCMITTVHQVPFVGKPGLGSRMDVNMKVQRFWPSSFLQYLQSGSNQTTPTGSGPQSGSNQTTPTGSGPQSESNQTTPTGSGPQESSQCRGSTSGMRTDPSQFPGSGGHRIGRDDLQDTIGFFIAKFVKS